MANSKLSTEQQNIVSAAKGGGIIFAGRLFEQAGRFVIGFILARFLGAAGYGVYSLGDTILTLATGLGLLGLNAGVVQYIPFYQKRQDDVGLQGVVQTTIVVPTVCGILLGILALMFEQPIVQWFGKPELISIMPTIAFGLPFSIFLLASVSVIIGFKQMLYKVLAQDIGLTFIKLATILFFLFFFGLTANLAMVAHVIGVIIACGIMIYFIYKILPYSQPLKPDYPILKQLFIFSAPVYVTHLIQRFEGQIQTVLLGLLSSLSAIGIFTIAARISVVGQMFHASIVTVAMPHVSTLYIQQEWEQLDKFYQMVTKWTFSVNLPLFLIIILFPETIINIFGNSFLQGPTMSIQGIEFVPATLTLVILGTANLVNALTGICGVMLVMTEKPMLNAFNSILAFSLTFLINLWLIPTMGVVGAAIAQLITKLTLNCARLGQVMYIYNMVPYNQTYLKPIGAGGIAIGTAYILHHSFFSGMGLPGMLCTVLILLLTYAGSVVAFGLDVEDRLILSRVGNRFQKYTRTRKK